MRARRAIVDGLLLALLVAGAALMLSPFLWMLLVSLRPAGAGLFDANPWSPGQWLSSPPQWSNYRRALSLQPFAVYAWNTVVITALGILGEVASSSLVAYGFARFRFAGRRPLFILVLATMMLPAQVTMVPTFILFRAFHWIDTLKPLIVPAFFGSAFSIFLCRQYIMTLPVALDEAAVMDGASRFQIYWRILLPLSKPVLATVAVFSFLARWNDFMGPLIYVSSQRNFTLALGLASFQGEYSTDWNLMMAASLVVMSPCIVLFFLAQRVFVRGVVMSGIRE
jgi:multiple sugar transport system permease protein